MVRASARKAGANSTRHKKASQPTRRLAVQQTQHPPDVVIYRGPKSAIQLQYRALWDDLAL